MFIQVLKSLKSEVFVFLNQQLIRLKIPPQNLVPKCFSNPNSCQKKQRVWNHQLTFSYSLIFPQNLDLFVFFRPITFTEKTKQQPRHGCKPHRWCPRVASPRTWHVPPHRWRPDLFFRSVPKNMSLEPGRLGHF